MKKYQIYYFGNGQFQGKESFYAQGRKGVYAMVNDRIDGLNYELRADIYCGNTLIKSIKK